MSTYEDDFALAETGVSTCGDDFAFWTPKRIGEAIPADLFLGRYACTPGARDSSSYKPTHYDGVSPIDKPNIVHVQEVAAAPYHSIGRLVVHGQYRNTVTGESEEQDRKATAFYIGNSTLLTVAHAFSLTTETENGSYIFEETRGGVFIPASVGENDDGKHYGMFIFRSGRKEGYLLHPKYEPDLRNAQHDICKVSICKGIKDKKLINTIEDVNLQPFAILKDQNYNAQVERRPQAFWRAFGYPCGWSDVMNLIGVRGKFRSCDHQEIQLDTNPEILAGMSGGPWIVEDEGPDQGNVTQVNGVQAGNPPTIGSNYRAVSSYFSTDLFRELQLDI